MTPTYKLHLTNATLQVPRAEFYTALRHYSKFPTTTISLYEEAERDLAASNQPNPQLFAILDTIGIQRYQDDMYTQGRAQDALKTPFLSLRRLFNRTKDFHND